MIKKVSRSAAPFFYERGKKGVLFVHGFTGTPYIFRQIGKNIAKLGYSVSAPLMAGHGTNPDDLAQTNAEEWYESIEKAYLDLAARCTEVTVVGASFGGNLSCHLATKYPLKALILIGMPRWIYRHRLIYLVALILSLLGIRYYNKPIGKKVDENILLGGPNYSYLKIPMNSALDFFNFVDKKTDQAIRRLKVPTLIIQSNNDGLVKPKSGQYIFENLGSDHKELIWIDEPHHELHNGKNQKQIYSYVTSFMLR